MTIRNISSKSQWEQFLFETSPQSLFQSWSWGEIQFANGRTIWRNGLYIDDKLIGIWQIVKIVAKRGIYLHIRHGPIFSQQSKHIWRYFHISTLNFAVKQRAWFVRISPLLPNNPFIETTFHDIGMYPAPIHSLDGEVCWVLDILKDDEDLLMGMRKATRYEIRRGFREHIHIRKSYDTKLLPIFMKLYYETSRRHRFIPYENIEEEVRKFSKDKKILILVGEFGSQNIASAIIVFYGNQAIYRHGASIPSKVSASPLLQWVAIQEARKRGIPIYNFWGITESNNINHPWYGITQFKKGFGGRLVQYIHAHDAQCSVKYYLTAWIERLQKYLKRY